MVGLEGSPSMGMRITSSNAEWGGRPDDGDSYRLVPGRGVFSEELEAELAERGLADVRTTGIEHQLPGHDVEVERMQLDRLPARTPMEGDARGFRVAICADALVNPEPGGLDALAVCERTGFGVMQLPATWYPDGRGRRLARAGRRAARRVPAPRLRRRAPAAGAATPRPRASARRWPQRSRRSATACRRSTASDGDADALEAFLRAQPVPAAGRERDARRPRRPGGHAGRLPRGRRRSSRTSRSPR